jgi:hypothetical protein
LCKSWKNKILLQFVDKKIQDAFLFFPEFFQIYSQICKFCLLFPFCIRFFRLGFFTKFQTNSVFLQKSSFLQKNTSLSLCYSTQPLSVIFAHSKMHISERQKTTGACPFFAYFKILLALPPLFLVIF